MTSIITKKAEDKNSHLFKLDFFLNSFDKQFKELILLQDEIFKILNDAIKNINKSNNGG